MATTTSTTAATKTLRQRAEEFLKSIETRDPAPLAYAGRYLQHNLSVPDGVAGLAKVLEALPPGSARVRTVRAFEDGDFVFTHTEYDFFGPKIGFDVFRFEGGTIAEHWDNLQAAPGGQNPSGRSMTDGPTRAGDPANTRANKALVASFVDEVLLGGRLERAAVFCEGDRYLQHNPQVADGLSGLGAALRAFAAQGMAIRYERVHRVLGEGDFVLTMSEGSLGDRPTAYYDLFRVERGKIAEHWDVIEAIPPRDQWQNPNGKF